MLERGMKFDENKPDVEQYDRRTAKKDRRNLHPLIDKDRRSGIADRRSLKRKKEQEEEPSH